MPDTDHPTDSTDTTPAEDANTPPRRRRRATTAASAPVSGPRDADAGPRDDGAAPQAADVAPSATDAAAAIPDDDVVAPDGDDVAEVASAEAPGVAHDSVDVDSDAAEADRAAGAALPSFGLLFQAPDPTVAPRRRRATAPVQSPSERAVPDDDADATSGEVADVPRDASGAEPAAGSDPGGDDHGSDTEQGGDEQGGDEDPEGGRRRRRGGRGRRSRASQNPTGTGDDDVDGAASPSGTRASSGDERADDSEGEDSASVSSRRRRRRRRGSGGESEDPPGTVTKVREPRAKSEQPTAVKGSTRLEAKKQRRREGREAGRRRTIVTEAEFLARRESVERVMVVRGREDRIQIGVLEDGVLVEHYVSRDTTASMAGNIYLGRVQNVLPSMEAAFVDIGKGRNAVLYAGEVNWDAAGLETGQPRRIEHALSSGDTVLVQVTKDPMGHKGARLTSQISLPGRYLVYVPEGSMTGISRKLPDTERSRLKSILKQVVPDRAGVIVRTAAEGASEAELTADVERLTATWDKISAKADAAAKRKSGSGGAPLLLHGEPDLTVRVIRDVFTEDFASLVVSGEKAWSDVSGYVEDVAPDLAARLIRWTAEDDVFAAHRIDEQLAKAMDRKVWLPSGGSLVIDRTEAMTVVDVNTGKFVGSGGNLEETVTKNNLEAAEEIVRQLRLRDIGGIIVVDFIDMVLESNRDLVVRRLLECLGRDRTKHQVAEVTSLGLVQMTRKRVGSGLIEVFSEQCEHCGGRGLIVSSEPVDKGGTGGGETGSSRSGRSRRGGSAPVAEEPSRPSSGPTAAQIAAAAHAAAVRRTDSDGDPQESASTEPADTAEPVAADQAPSVAGVPTAEPPVAEAPERKRRRRGRVVAPAGPPRGGDAEPSADEHGPAPSERVESEPVRSEPVESEPGLVESEPVESQPVESEPELVEAGTEPPDGSSDEAGPDERMPSQAPAEESA
ncbi:MAG: Rne/Rng family ribonuclease [Dermatophilaceae bacterium]